MNRFICWLSTYGQHFNLFPFLKFFLQNLSLVPLAIYFIIYPSSVLDSLSLDIDFFTAWSSKTKECYMRKYSVVSTFGKLCDRVWDLLPTYCCYFFTLHSTLNSQCLTFPFYHYGDSFLVTVYSDQQSQRLLDLCHIWRCHPFSFLAPVIVPALRQSFISDFQGPRALCRAFRSSLGLCPWPSFSAHGGLQCLRHTWLTDVCVCVSCRSSALTVNTSCFWTSSSLWRNTEQSLCLNWILNFFLHTCSCTHTHMYTLSALCCYHPVV